jgi:DNA polymerase III alpha subunit
VAFFFLEDTSGRVEVVVPPAVYNETEEKIRTSIEQPVLASATLELPDEGGESDDSTMRLILKDIDSIESVRRTRTREVHIYTLVDGVPDGALAALQSTLASHSGRCPVVLHLRIPGQSETELVLPPRWAVTPGDDLIDAIERSLEQCRVEFR